MFEELRELMHGEASCASWCRVLDVLRDIPASQDTVAHAYIEAHAARWDDRLRINPPWMEFGSSDPMWDLIRCLRLSHERATDIQLARLRLWEGMRNIRWLEICETETSVDGLCALGDLAFAQELEGVVLQRVTLSERVVQAWKESVWFGQVRAWGFEGCLLSPRVLEVCLHASRYCCLERLWVREEEGFGEVPSACFEALGESEAMEVLQTLSIGPIMCDQARVMRWASCASYGPLRSLEWIAAQGAGASSECLEGALKAPWARSLHALVLRGHCVRGSGLATLRRGLGHGRFTELRVEDAELRDHDLRELLADGTGHLQTLGFARNRISNEGVLSLARSEALRSVESLDVSGNAVYEDGVRALLESDHLKTLRSLNAGYSRVRPRERERLKHIAMLRGVSLQLAMPFEGARGAIRAWGVNTST